ncbi:necrosis and ethylene-inducing protein-inducing protein [Apodospora peruviana]|uniref:Necrosis and ethylene-inducing protein-inducing protein n=1 Tax=Apodospora peruviana TaxID=516989 RepID=A0AAE0MG25_9PEZI|nr:necrosis and ethylene-inducing protein-inducing protein [Apodospora peruviana]
MLFHLSLLVLSSSLPLSWGLMAVKPRDDHRLPDKVNHPEIPDGPPPGPLFLRAPELDKRFQPALDFDTDSCYNVPAIGPPPNNDIALGLNPFTWPPQRDCRNEEMLARGNVYSRQRCNNGYCVVFYAYYFQKDRNTLFKDFSHRHDWEHIAVWVRMSDWFATHVAVSQHKGYEIKDNAAVPWTAAGDGKPAVVYHQDSGLTHCFRFANGDDMANQENHWHRWITGPLIGYYGWDSVEQRERMFTHDWEGAVLAIKDDATFADNIRKARPEGITFDENKDDDTTNFV